MPSPTKSAELRQLCFIRGRLAALTALLHADDPEGPAEALVALQAVKAQAGNDQAFWLYELLRAMMSAQSYQRLEAFVMLSPESYLPKTDFERLHFGRGKAEGKAEAILEMLEERGIAVTTEQRDRILAEHEPVTLRRWVRQAFTLTSCSELFK